MSDARSFYDAEEVVLRHVKQAFGAVPAGATGVSVLGINYYAVAAANGGINGLAGPQGFVSGRYARRIGDAGDATITLANAEGPDGIMHRNRFDIITRGRSTSLGGAVTTYAPGSYRPGDEWIEVWPARGGRQIGSEPKFVGTPTQAQVTPASIELTLADRWGWALGDRETTLGFWRAAPGTVIREYQGIWRAINADGFEDASTYVNDGAVHTSANGQWTYQKASASTALSDAVRLDGTSAGTDPYVRAASNLITGAATSAGRWWMQATVRINGTVSGSVVGGRWLTLGDRNGAVRLALAKRSDGRWGYLAVTTSYSSLATTQLVPNSGRVTLRIEQNGAWIYFMGDGQVIDVLPAELSVDIQPNVSIGTGNGTGTADVLEFTTSRRDPLFAAVKGEADHGDQFLPPNLQPGGMLGRYYSLAQWSNKTDSEALARAFSPGTEPVEERIDQQINFPGATPPAWQPPLFLNGEHFGAIWTGAIYLDLANFDYRLRLEADGALRLQIGVFTGLSNVLNAWTNTKAQTATTPLLRGYIAQSVSGWYALEVEYANLTGKGGIILKYERSDTSGTFNVVPSTMLSTQGVYEDLVRLESHHDAIQKVATFAGLQTTCEPRSLESPGFPGQIIPRVRQGRDVDYELTEKEATGAQLSVDATDVADLITADAVGLADPKSATQITAQAMNRREALKHLQMRQTYLSIADVTDSNVAAQQLEQQVYLASSPWEEVSAGSDGASLLVDAFPLPATPNRQVFGWEPGDAPRIDLPNIGVIDGLGRQLMGVEWTFSPNGFGRPNASWRARPRDDARTLRMVYQAALNPKRNYQGQLVVVNGQLGSTNGSTPNAWSQVALPPRAKVVSAHVVISSMSAVPSASNFTITMNGSATGWLVNRPGQYDVTAWADEQGVGLRSFYSNLTGGGGTTFTQQLVVILRV